VATKVADALDVAWTADLGGRLTQPVIAGGRAFVSSVEEHTVHALDAGTGKPAWTFTAGARVDSPPVVDGGQVIFGCADGWVYCLRASDGALAWRFLAAPEERLIGAFGQLESVWPVHGAVLLQGGSIYATAGRSSYLDGGIRIVRLDPATGKQLSESLVHHIDPATGKQIGAERRGTFDMEGTLSDVLSGDGESFFLKHLRFGPSGTPMSESKPHLFSMTGFLHEEWFVRSYWQYGAQIGAGWGRWASPANQAPFGRILCFDDESIYGYGRVKVQGGATGHRAEATHFFCSPKTPPPAPKKDLRGEATPKGKKKRGRPKTPPKTYRWSKPVPIMVRAMAVASDRVVAAGVPDAGKKAEKLLAFDNQDEAVEAFSGGKGGILWVVSAKDGSKLSELKLEAPPINDGLAAAHGKVFLSLRNGKLLCLAGK
jgi:outer membrane protein assembly factor BamB